MTTAEIFGYLLVTFMGCFMLYHGAFRLYFFFKLKKPTNFANGIVLTHVKGEAYRTTLPVVQFLTNDNKTTIEGIPKNAIPVKGVHFHRTGDNLKVYYDPENPETFVTNTISDHITCAFSALGGSLFIYAVIISLYRHFVK